MLIVITKMGTITATKNVTADIAMDMIILTATKNAAAAIVMNIAMKNAAAATAMNTVILTATSILLRYGLCRRG